MKKKHIFLIAVNALLILLLSVLFAFSWFTFDEQFNSDVTGKSIRSYFAGGTGAETDPYIITSKRHMNNLAWLQYLGKFQDKQVFFKLNPTNKLLDMSGYAIPPIGTFEKPFYGNFNGNGATIKNLWVSSIYSELKTNLSESEFDAGAYIGLFGKIGTLPSAQGGDPIAGSASNFYLENLRISTATNNAKIGLVAGLADGNLQYIGVSNSQIKVASGAVATSDHTLIGQKGDNIYWDNEPGVEKGGDLIIDPYGNGFTAVGAGSFKPVPSALEDKAFFMGNLTKTNTQAFTLNYMEKNAGGGYTQRPINNDADVAAYDINKEFYARWNTLSGKAAMIYFEALPDFNNPLTVTLKSGAKKDIPRNCIWFQPVQAGNCAIVFAPVQPNTDKDVSIFKFARDIGGNIISKTETRLTIPGSNGGVNYFDYEITQQDIADGYEYVIGSTTTDKPPAFLYLILAGTDITGAGVATMKNVDYVYRSGGAFPDMALASYIRSNTALTLATSGASDVAAYYNKLLNGGAARVYYSQVGGGITLGDRITNGSDGQSIGYDINIFPEFLF